MDSLNKSYNPCAHNGHHKILHIFGYNQILAVLLVHQYFVIVLQNRPVSLRHKISEIQNVS